jgi:hypothetical protein
VVGEPCSSMAAATLAAELQSYSIRILLHENSVHPSTCCTFSFKFCVVTPLVVTHYYSAATRYNSAATLSVTLLQLTITMLVTLLQHYVVTVLSPSNFVLLLHLLLLTITLLQLAITLLQHFL